ncbi:hypothetical protein [Brucella anthropi]|uniref:hypothetical protein n=1 Tax=Brucella anthropi TaxID=529 RepID=UPI000288FDA9|nr:hypothetical protein [Brucella anthropi]
MPEIKTIYFKGDGKSYDMPAIDANRALREHSGEWSQEPWPKAKQPKADAKTDTSDAGANDKTDQDKTDLLGAGTDDKAKAEQNKG